MAIEQLEHLGWELLGKERQEDGWRCARLPRCWSLTHGQRPAADAPLVRIVPTSAICRGSSAPALTGISQLCRGPVAGDLIGVKRGQR